MADAGERHVINYACGLLGYASPSDDVQHSNIARVQPRPRKAQIGARSRLQTEQIDVEAECLVEVVGQDREVVHPMNHLSPPQRGSRQ